MAYVHQLKRLNTELSNYIDVLVSFQISPRDTAIKICEFGAFEALVQCHTLLFFMVIYGIYSSMFVFVVWLIQGQKLAYFILALAIGGFGYIIYITLKKIQLYLQKMTLIKNVTECNKQELSSSIAYNVKSELVRHKEQQQALEKAIRDTLDQHVHFSGRLGHPFIIMRYHVLCRGNMNHELEKSRTLLFRAQEMVHDMYAQ